MELQVAVRKRLGDFSLSAEFTASGDRTGVFGESGSGKSTLVNLMAGLSEPDQGEIFLDGDCLFSRGKGINVPPERRRVAVVFQRPLLFPHLSVLSNLLYGRNRRIETERKVGFDAVADTLRLEPLLERGVNRLSGGERQRVALGRALLASPRLLLMDEPLSALDDDLKFRIIPFIRIASERFRIPFLFISHSLVEMRLMVDRVFVAEKGRIAEQTTPDGLARARMGSSPVGYINLLKTETCRLIDGLFSCRWGATELLISAGGEGAESTYELSSKDILLFKRHPEATSARNLLECMVESAFPAGNRLGVELSCAGNRLVAEITHQAAKELGIVKGCSLFAAIKASAFRRLGGPASAGF